VWRDAVVEYGETFIDELWDGKAYNLFDSKELGQHQFEIKDKGTPINDILLEIKKAVDIPGLNAASGGHLGYIPGGGLYPAALGDYIAAFMNKYSGVYFGGPGAVRLENALIRWMCKVIGFPNTALGNLASGGSVASLTAIVTARDAKQIDSTNIRKSVIYLTNQAHHCIQKAIRISGLGEAKLSYVPLKSDFTMDEVTLQEMVEVDKSNGLNPFLIIATAGTTDTGVIDPLDAIANIAKANDMWLHIDGAYGGFFIMLEELKHLFKGIERADSIVIDPHKGMFLPYGLGAVLVRDVKALFNSHRYMAGEANYLQDVFEIDEDPSPADLSPELTKHFRGMRMWLPLKLFGVDTFKAGLTEKYYLTQYFYEEIQKLDFEVGPKPALSVAIYRYAPKDLNLAEANELNKKLVELVKADGRVFVSSTTLDGVYWIRLATLSFRTHLKHIEILLEMLKLGVEKYYR
jgi:glutamate/tyrosine decarboxylase-like PLP-dependent enzyme